MTETAPRTISLNDVGLKYVQALQRITDLCVFTWAGARTVNEQGYDELGRTIPGLPSTEFRIPFNAARDEAEVWWFKNGVNEVLGLTNAFLEDIRKLCGLIAFTAAKAQANGDLAGLAAEINSTPTALDFPTRLKQLAERYAISVPMDAHLLSIVALGRILFQRNGLIGEGESLKIVLKVVQAPAQGETQPRLADYERSWKTGERVLLSRAEQAAVFTTISVFIGAMLNAVQEFAKRSGLPDEPAQK